MYCDIMYIVCIILLCIVPYSELIRSKCCEGSINMQTTSSLVLGLARIHHRQSSWLLGKLTGAIISMPDLLIRNIRFCTQRMLRIWRVHMKNRRKHNLWLLVYRISTPPLPGVLMYHPLGLVMWTCCLLTTANSTVYYNSTRAVLTNLKTHTSR